MNIKPRKLESGDSIGVIAPSRSLKQIHQKWIDIAIRHFEAKNLNVIFSDHCREDWHGNGGTIEQRVSDMMDMFTDDRVKAILAAVGGFNSNQLLQHLDYKKIQRNPKIFCGYSDITALHNAIHTKTGLVTFYGPHFCTFGDPFQFDYTVQYFDEIMSGKKDISIEESPEYSADNWYENPTNPAPRNKKPNPGTQVIRPGEAEGELVGGNISTLTSLLGTEYLPSFKDKILFLEEGDDSDCRSIDRYLTQLQLSGAFNELKGMMVGRFHPNSGFNDNQKPEELLNRVTKDLKGPVIYGADFGHTDPIATIPIGVPCLVDANRKKIQYLESGVL
ncbi:LD-carboxypeptidase [Candidatus Peribacteria bacterium]|nr:LD-carboxypeptidase [Candidatus Peribacteria bacterium]